MCLCFEIFNDTFIECVCDLVFLLASQDCECMHTHTCRHWNPLSSQVSLYQKPVSLLPLDLWCWCRKISTHQSFDQVTLHIYNMKNYHNLLIMCPQHSITLVKFTTDLIQPHVLRVILFAGRICWWWCIAMWWICHNTQGWAGRPEGESRKSTPLNTKASMY